MYLTKAVFNLKSRKSLSALVNANEMHKLVMSMFEYIDSDTPRKDMGILYLVDIKGNDATLLIQSNIIPNGQILLDSQVMSSIQTKSLDNLFSSIKNGDTLYLEVLSEPYKKVKNSNSKNSRRKILTKSAEKIEWFEKKIKEHGCNIIKHDIASNTDTIYGRKGSFNFIYKPSVYRCCVKVTDTAQLIELLKTGLGSGKAYGMGMFKTYR